MINFTNINNEKESFLYTYKNGILIKICPECKKEIFDFENEMCCYCGQRFITLDNIKRLLAFIIYPDNLFMVFNLQKEINEFVIYKYDLCRSFIKLNFLNTTTKEYKILLTYANKLENDIALNSGNINISLLKENEILKEKNKMLVNLIFNSTSINGSNNDSTKTIEYYKSENERLKELMKIIVNINKKYVNSLNNDIKDKLTVK